MSWNFLGNDRQAQEVRNALSRLLNTSLSLGSKIEISAEQDERHDTRLVRATPVVVLPLYRKAENLNLGVTTDISSEGMAITSLGPIPMESKLAIGIGKIDEFSVFLGECKRTTPIGYGYYKSGLQITELLNTQDYLELQHLVQHLEENPPSSLFDLLDPAGVQ